MQIKAIDNRIASLKKDLKSQINSGSKVAKRIKAEIKWLEEKRASVCTGINLTSVIFLFQAYINI